MLDRRCADASGPTDGPVVAVFCMRYRGHIQRTVAVVSSLVAAGCEVHVWTHRSYRELVERAGGRFVNLFQKHSMAAADSHTMPKASRMVTFAGRYLDPISADVAAIKPQLVVYDTFAVIAPAVALRLGLPYVNICAGHNLTPATVDGVLRDSVSHFSPSSACLDAVARLREVGLTGASPSYFMSATSPYLNVYCEPPQFLLPEERSTIEPMAFFGSLTPGLHDRPPAVAVAFPRRTSRRVYVSLGTLFGFAAADTLIDRLQQLADALRQASGASVLLSLGGARVRDDRLSVLRWPNVRIAATVPQWHVLAEADVFVTHHGLNSTHEAIYHGVPMVSCPLWGDQPALARRCQSLGLAAPLVADAREPIEPGAVLAALAQLEEDAAGYRDRLAQAREWEQQVIADRPNVVARMLELT